MRRLAQESESCQYNVDNLKCGALERRTWSDSSGPAHVPAVYYRSLVNSAISPRSLSRAVNAYHHTPLENTTFFQVFRQDLHYNNGVKLKQYDSNTSRGTVDSFSAKSKRRLLHLAANSDMELTSTFILTYHLTEPTGLEVKRHLKNFLKCLSRRFPDSTYLWILEFQNRGAPHYHVYTSIPSPTDQDKNWVAKSWNRITKESEKHRWQHAKSDNWRSWKMGTGKYLTKYLDKQSQKNVPEGYDFPGRFWGHSRNLKTSSQIITAATLAKITPYPWSEKAIASYFRKCLKNYQDNRMKNAFNAVKLSSPGKAVKRTSRLKFNNPGKTAVNTGAPIFWQLVNYICSTGPDLATYNHAQNSPRITGVPF